MPDVLGEIVPDVGAKVWESSYSVQLQHSKDSDTFSARRVIFGVSIIH